MDLAKMLVNADIPAAKLGHPCVRQFFSKYLKRELPTESTIRKNYMYIPKLCDQKIEEIRKELSNEYSWGAEDETTDACGRIVANVFAGKTDLNFIFFQSRVKILLLILTGALKERVKSYLIDVQYIASSNHATVVHVLIEAVKVVLGDGSDFSKILLLSTDSASHMIKMTEGVSDLPPHCIHITCLAHGGGRHMHVS